MTLISNAYLTRMLSVLVLGAILSSCSKTDSNNPTVDVFQVSTPLLKDTSYTTSYIAEIQAVQHAEIRSRVDAYIEKVHIQEGQQVKKGQLLFSLSSQEFKEELYKASAALKNTIAEAKAAEVDLRSTAKLVENNVVSKMELEIAQSRLDALHAKIEEAKAYESSAKLRLSFTEIRAPFDGIVDRIPKKAGSLVSDGEILTFLSDAHEVIAYFNLPEGEYIEYLKSKQSGEKRTARLELVNGDLHPYTGTVEAAEGQIDRSTGNIAFRAQFANPDLLLRHGASGKVLIEKNLDDVLVIPQKSTFEIQDKIYVFRVDENNIARQTEIHPRLRIPHFYILESGLKTSDRILYEGVQRVKDGESIAVEEISSKAVFANLSNHSE